VVELSSVVHIRTGENKPSGGTDAAGESKRPGMDAPEDDAGCGGRGRRPEGEERPRRDPRVSDEQDCEERGSPQLRGSQRRRTRGRGRGSQRPRMAATKTAASTTRATASSVGRCPEGHRSHEVIGVEYSGSERAGNSPVRLRRLEAGSAVAVAHRLPCYT